MSETDEIVFSTMDEQGKVTTIKVLKNSDIGRCPKYILVPEHYRDDGTCRCNVPQCDYEGCTSNKYGEEIYCRNHLLMYGINPDDFDDEC